MTRTTKKAKTQALPAQAALATLAHVSTSTRDSLELVEDDLDNISTSSESKTDDLSSEEDELDDNDKSISSSDTVVPPDLATKARSPSQSCTSFCWQTQERQTTSQSGGTRYSLSLQFWIVPILRIITTENPKKKITYLIAILPPEEAKKAQSKQVPVSNSLELWSNEPWDTVKAQFLWQQNLDCPQNGQWSMINDQWSMING